MYENAAQNSPQPLNVTPLTPEDVAMVHKVHKILKTGRDVVIRQDSKGKPKIYRLTQETA